MFKFIVFNGGFSERLSGIEVVNVDLSLKENINWHSLANDTLARCICNDSACMFELGQIIMYFKVLNDMDNKKLTELLMKFAKSYCPKVRVG